MKNIQMFMCCHSAYEIVPPMCRPIQCGAALNPPISGALPDNVGDNISIKNREYCELTAHYFAWKNVSADYYGFCHYRRFFCVDDSIKRPYVALKSFPDSNLLGNEDQWRQIISKYDIIVPRSEDMGLSVQEHYNTSKNHFAEDLQMFIGILKSVAPYLSQAADRYLSQNRQYFCNMFIMNRTYFNQYCEILFPALEKFDQRKTLHGNFQSDRTDGYLGEIFTGIYITYCMENGVEIKQIPRLEAHCSTRKQLLYTLLPPESKRRFWAKELAKKIRGY